MKLLPSRDALVFASLCIAFTLVAVAVFSFVYTILSPQTAAALRALPAHTWWLSYPPAATRDAAMPSWVLGSVTVTVFLACVFSFGARRLLKASSSSLVLFFLMYLLFTCLESLRGLAAIFYASNVSVAGNIVLTRIVYGGRYAGSLSLLLLAVYALKLTYTRHSVLIAILLLVSFAVALYIPVDGTDFLSPFTFKLGDEQGAWFVDLALLALTAASLVAAGFSTRQKAYYVLAAAAVVLEFGREGISFSGSRFLLVAGAVSYLVGALMFLGTLKRIYRNPESS